MKVNKIVMTSLLIIALIIYALSLYLVITETAPSDFHSLYSSLTSFISGLNPYGKLIGNHLTSPKFIAANLNTPSTLFLLQPLALFNYKIAFTLYSFSSLILLMFSCYLLARPIFKLERQECVAVFTFALLGFPSILSFTEGQLGIILFFLMSTGYYFDRNNKPWLTGLFWGTAIALRLFPGLLLIYCLIQKKYRTLLATSSVFILLALLPVFNHSILIYKDYLKVIDFINWYGSSWNGSLLGFLYRLPIRSILEHNPLIIIQTLYVTLFLLGIISYMALLKKWQASSSDMRHWMISLTTLVMLLLSPLSWVYYYPILILPLIQLYKTMSRYKYSQYHFICWGLFLLFINLPTDNMKFFKMHSMFYTFTLGSFYFYGLIACLYLVLSLSRKTMQLNCSKEQSTTAATLTIYATTIYASLTVFFLQLNSIAFFT